MQKNSEFLKFAALPQRLSQVRERMGMGESRHTKGRHEMFPSFALRNLYVCEIWFPSTRAWKWTRLPILHSCGGVLSWLLYCWESRLLPREPRGGPRPPFLPKLTASAANVVRTLRTTQNAGRENGCVVRRFLTALVVEAVSFGREGSRELLTPYWPPPVHTCKLCYLVVFFSLEHLSIPNSNTRFKWSKGSSRLRDAWSARIST